MNVIDKINAQQNGKLLTDAWMVGELLKDMVRKDPYFEKTVDQVLDMPSGSLENAAGLLKDFEDARRRRGDTSCVPLVVQEKILWDFYSNPLSRLQNPAPITSEKTMEMPSLFMVTRFGSQINILADRLEIRGKKLYVWAGSKLQLSISLSLLSTEMFTAENNKGEYNA